MYAVLWRGPPRQWWTRTRDMCSLIRSTHNDDPGRNRPYLETEQNDASGAVQSWRSRTGEPTDFPIGEDIKLAIDIMVMF